MLYWIANDLAVDSTRSEQLADNGKKGDARVTLYRAPAVMPAGGGWAYYLDTNGNPVSVGPYSDDETIVECASDLGVTPNELRALVESGRDT
jgi:hypothetical protein